MECNNRIADSIREVMKNYLKLLSYYAETIFTICTWRNVQPLMNFILSAAVEIWAD